MKQILFLLNLIFVCVTSYAQTPPLCFNVASVTNSVSVGANPRALTYADFNGDGNIDLATANSGSNNISVLMGSVSGIYTAAVSYTTSNFPVAILSADFNGDGKIDLVTANSNSNNVSVLLNNGTGGFAAAVGYTVGTQPQDIVSADVNNDGKMDLVTANYSSNDISVLIGTGLGTFAPKVNYNVGVQPKTTAVNDFNGDGSVDLAVANAGSNNVSVLMGSASGTFAAAINYAVGTNPRTVISDDYNGDGKFDLAISNMGSSYISLLMGSGSGTFTSVNYNFGSISATLTSADLNNDGKADVIASILNTSSIAVLLSYGNGSFASPITMLIGGSPTYVVVDVNSDGNKDLVTADYNANNVSIINGFGNGRFMLSSSFITAPGLRSMASGDLNSDGMMDLVVGGVDSSRISILIATGSGFFATAVDMNNFPDPEAIAIEDFNSDGIADVLVANSSYTGTAASLLTGLGNGSFTAPVLVGTGKSTKSIITNDFNSDGKVDLAVANIGVSSNNVGIRLGSGTGTFPTGSNYATSNSPNAVVSADFNSDGKTDIAAVNMGSNNISILMGSGTGTFAAAVNYAVGSSPQTLVSGDFNGDGKPDLAVINFNANNVSVLLNSGTGTFATAVNYVVGTSPQSITSGDYNGDGKIDLAIANWGSNNISVLAGSGTGTFLPKVNYAVGNQPHNIISVDFNNDGKLDIATANEGSDDVTILLNGSINVLTSTNFVCLGDNIILQASGAGPFSWSTGANTSSISVSPTVNTTYTVTGTAVAGCSNVAVKTISVSASPTITATNSQSVLCSGASSTLTVNGATTYTWSTGANTASILVTPTITTIYTVTGSSGGTCVDTKTLSVTVANPVISSIGTTNILSCMNSIAQCTISAIGAYQWSGPGIVSGGTTANPIVFMPGIYSVTVTGANSCTTSNTVAVSSNTTSPVFTLTPSMLSVCAGSSVSISANQTGTNSVSYLWDNSATTQSVAVNPSVTSVYSATVTDNTNGCYSIQSSTINVDALPTLTITGTNTVCLGTSTGFIANGATTYLWNTAQTTSSISVNPALTTTYTVWGTNMNGCVNTQTVSVTVDNTCADVWPGDANNDGTADNLDVLELGLHYTQTGAPRVATSNTWQSYFANNWTGTITNGKNLNHSDCNGDGVINDDDTLAIYNNYGLTHAFKPAQTTTVNPQLSIVPDQAMVTKGSWGTASVYLGDATNTITNINGVAFTIDFDNTLIEPNSIYVEYQNSFIDAGQNLHFQKPDFANSKLFTASTHTVSNNVSGFGKIATLHYQIKSSLATDEVLNIGISQANQSNASGTISSLTSGTGTLMAIGASVGVKENIMNGNVMISPNPTNSILNISFNTIPQNTKIELYNSIGALVLSEQMIGKNNTVNVSELSVGIYFMKVLEGNKVVVVKKVIKE